MKTYPEAVAAVIAGDADSALSNVIHRADETGDIVGDIVIVWRNRLNVTMPAQDALFVALSTALEMGVRIGLEMSKEGENEPAAGPAADPAATVQ